MKNLIILFAVITLFSSCGRDGAPGAQGPAGNANVFSVVYNVPTWIYDNTYYEFYADLNVPEISNSVISGGTVQVFEGDASGGSTIWYALPYLSNLNVGLEVSYSITYGNVRIERYMANGNTPPAPAIHQYKVVIIPPI